MKVKMKKAPMNEVGMRNRIVRLRSIIWKMHMITQPGEYYTPPAHPPAIAHVGDDKAAWMEMGKLVEQAINTVYVKY